MLFRVVIVVLGLFSMGSSVAQTKADYHVNEGDKFFEQMAYSRAIPEYTIAAELGAVSEHVTRRLGMSYMNIGKTLEAEQWFASVVKFMSREPLDMYNYAEALKSNGRYEEAEEWMDRYLLVSSNDANVRRSNINGFAKKLTQDTDRFTVRSVGINTPYSDFGTCWLGTDKVLFSSSRNLTTIVERRAAWNDQPFLDLFTADRGSDMDLTNANTVEGDVNTKLHEGPATASKSGDVIWFTRNSFFKGRKQKSQNGISRLGIYKAYPKNNGWGNVEQFLFNNPEISVGHPALSTDGRTLYFVSDMPGGYGGSDIYVCRDQGGQWGEPENLGNAINTAQDEVFPYVSAKGTLYFASNGHPGLGGLDIYAAQRMENGMYKSAVNVGAPINGPKDDFAFIIDADDEHGYFSSNRSGGMGDDDIYRFDMLAPLDERYLCTGHVIDDEFETPVIAAEVQLYDMNKKLIGTAFTDANGEYTFPVEKNKAYRVVAKMAGRYDGQGHFSTENIEQEQITTRDVHLVADAGVWMRGAVSYKDRLGFIEGMNISVVNTSSFSSETTRSGSGGDFSMRLQTNEEFEVLFEKAGFFGQSVPVSTVGMKQGVIDLNQARDLRFEPIVLDSAIALKFVRWNSSSATLDPLAKTELDALAERMLVNPQLVIEICVYTDARGDVTKHQPMTQKQAEAATAYLVSKAVPKDRLVARGFGSSRILNRCVAGTECSDEEHAVNRRTEYKVVKVL